MSVLPTPSALPISTLTGDPVVCVPSAATLRQIADVLATQGISAVGVGTSEELEGIVTERDVVRAVAAGLDPAGTTAGDIATTELAWATPDATVSEVATEMLDQWVRHMLVGDDGKLVGIVSSRDLLGVFAASSPPDEG